MCMSCCPAVIEKKNISDCIQMLLAKGVKLKCLLYWINLIKLCHFLIVQCTQSLKMSDTSPCKTTIPSGGVPFWMPGVDHLNSFCRIVDNATCYVVGCMFYTSLLKTMRSLWWALFWPQKGLITYVRFLLLSFSCKEIFYSQQKQQSVWTFWTLFVDIT